LEIKKVIKQCYVRLIRPHLSNKITEQRLKLIWDIWGYYRLFTIINLRLTEKIKLFWRFFLIDWNVVHAHKPLEIALVCQALAGRPALAGETLLEAGCWQGGSSAKFSIICKMFGYKMHIYDSFEGVEILSPDKNVEGTYDFSGEYKASEVMLRNNLEKYGEKEVCTVHKGWFVDTLAKDRLPFKVGYAFIDCDLAKGTKEVLMGVVPVLISDGIIFTQDYHIKPVRQLLDDKHTWDIFGKGLPIITRKSEKLAMIKFIE
jgi:O-methyltransferase